MTFASKTTTGKTVRRRGLLLAEDDPEMRSLMEAVLADEGFAVESVPDGLALVARAAERPDLVLIVTDLQMPNLTGLGAVRRIRRLGLEVPILLITAYGNPRVHGEALRLGASAVLDKPFKMSTLRELATKLSGGAEPPPLESGESADVPSPDRRAS